MNFKLIKSHAKVNLSLGVVGKLQSGYHKVESLVSFLNFYDEIKIKKIIGNNHKIKFFGKFSKGIKKKNTIYKLLKTLDRKKILNNQKYLIKVKKNIPQKAGLGGGSMNASAIISYLVFKKILNFSKKDLINLSKQIGSDVQLGINTKNKILYSNGKFDEKSKKNNYLLLLLSQILDVQLKKFIKV